MKSKSLVVLVCLSMWLAVASAQEDVAIKALEKDIDAFKAQLIQLRRAVDKSKFDPEALLDQLDYEAELILDYVSNDIAFQPYEGVLRGVAGTLRARAGNSLDQSILLASVLKSAGYDARVVKAELSAADALRLLRTTAAATPAADLAYLDAEINKRFPDATGPAAQDVRGTKAFADAQQQEPLLLATLRDAGIDLAAVDVTQRWIPVLQDYFWVQHRDGPSADWEDAHPAFGNAAPPAGLTPQEFFVDTVPEKYHQTFTFQAFMEQMVTGKVTKHALMKPWTMPVANTSGKALRYTNAPSGLNVDTIGDLDKALNETNFLIPNLNGGRPPGMQAFDLRGVLIDPFALGSPAAGLFQTLGDKMAQATEGVIDDPDGKPVMALHSMWLEFTFTAPSGKTRTDRRYLVAPRSVYSESNEELLYALITDHTYIVSTGGEPLDYLADRYLELTIEGTEWLKTMLHKSFFPDEGTPLPAALPADFPVLTQYWLMDRQPTKTNDVVTYRAEPGLMGFRRGHRDAETGFAAVDVVWNALEHVRVTGNGIEHDARAAASRGVWDTALEAVPAMALRLEAESMASTAQTFRLAREQDVPLEVLPAGSTPAAGAVGLDTTAQAFLQQDLDRGYAAVIPSRVPDGSILPAWWRVNPQTGETLGMTGDGYGQELQEYLEVLEGMINTFNDLGSAVRALHECENRPSFETKLCCVVEAHINNVAGQSFGGILGATTGSAGGRLFAMAQEIPVSDNPLAMPEANAGCNNLPPTGW